MPWTIEPPPTDKWLISGGFTVRYLVQEQGINFRFLLEDSTGGALLLEKGVAASALLWHQEPPPQGDWNIQAGPI